MRCVELFAGAGGAAIGLERAGIEHAALVEWDAHACATMRAAGLGPVVEGDVRDLAAIEAEAGPTCDVLWSSFPCQAWSTAGNRKGASDDRNGWPWTVAAADHFRPAWFLGENVRGLTLHKGGCGFRDGQDGLFGGAPVLDCTGCYFERVILPDLRARFACVGWWLLDAADFGVPQHRRRVILWAGPVPLVEPAPTHGPRVGREWVSMGEALGLAGGDVASGICHTDPGTHGNPRDVAHPSPTVPVSSGLYTSARMVGAVAGSHDTGRKPREVDGPAPTVTTEAGHPVPWSKAGVPFVVDPAHLARPSPTVSAFVECAGSGPGGKPEKRQRASDALYLGTGRRRLTVAECATLQAFPATWPWQGTVSSQYRQVGNAVAPPMAEVVGRALMAAAKVHKEAER